MSTTDALSKARAHIETALIEKATSDKAFREVLKNNPHDAIKQMLGTDPIPSFKITVIEEQAGEITLVLPRAIAQDELPDELLDLASGGIGFSAFLTPEQQYGKVTWDDICPKK